MNGPRNASPVQKLILVRCAVLAEWNLGAALRPTFPVRAQLTRKQVRSNPVRSQLNSVRSLRSGHFGPVTVWSGHCVVRSLCGPVAVPPRDLAGPLQGPVHFAGRSHIEVRSNLNNSAFRPVLSHNREKT
jgi:hypothetical protein